MYLDTVNYTLPLDTIKPYLRPMSSMTEEEMDEYNLTFQDDRTQITHIGKYCQKYIRKNNLILHGRIQ